ncbi:hypothetical protein EIN_111530 [Entamoeba invadens IP1]|uniref:Leucine rich repeat containing protein BspA family protein n=1 Tax=Entamoeba invadens IP1 TaxID=370355 RepID=A0A0A1U3Q7_ENTIV|nr:hypothetical protein EIN_111530 [Entamoeba invadens IP1]ELP86229.1 hypothetical protein EIN_111530 [Entamoeba invadens IP1]|eukprot:XP_004185575.1 hypothetical protein EIN_111530 [Entamoeba invadens IP1]
MGKVDGFHLMIVAKHFNIIQDFINVQLVCKKYKETLMKFHYNPIPINFRTRKYFPNLETQHLFSKKNERYKNGKIVKYKILYPISEKKYIREKKKSNIANCVVFKSENSITNALNLDLEKNPNYFTSYGYELFSHNTSCTNLTIPSNITALGMCCFYRCENLKSIKITGDVQVIPKHCFVFCQWLTHVELPNTLYALRADSFAFCDALKTIRLPDNLKVLAAKSFSHCTNLESIVIPSQVVSIPKNCFENCKSLTSVILPPNLEKISKWAFKNSGLNEIELPPTLTQLGIKCFSDCFYLSHISTSLEECRKTGVCTVPSKISELKLKCFECCNFSAFYIPSNVVVVEEKCFYCCDNMTSLTVEEGIMSIDPSYTSGCNELGDIVLLSKDVKMGSI